ncbi:UNVERIFIED_CONTAM: hypothetical protein Slati_2610600 [Sesamum latifolium]|uniref:Hydroxyproline-rich glycoprotein family protein n=1 Tax=Sesamum latifolium TaxID=2727402 RepID=A0AAW2VU09_9LAMI
MEISDGQTGAEELEKHHWLNCKGVDTCRQQEYKHPVCFCRRTCYGGRADSVSAATATTSTSASKSFWIDILQKERVFCSLKITVADGQTISTRKRWGDCWGGLSCFRKQNGGKRIVPASRIPEANTLSNQPNGPQAGGLPSQTTGIALSLLAPPSSPASFSNSALPSTAQSPSCFLSANSPGGPSSTMFVTGPYAHETQLVSPPVFSTFTTEPSTAPLTPPPELAHLTTPSSPDVPYAHFLSSSAKIKGTDKTSYIAGNDLQATYSLYPGSPASTLRSPVSRTSGDCLSSSFTEREFPPQWESSIPSQEHATKSDSGRFLGIPAAGASKTRQDSNFFCPETFAQFYLDQSSFSNSGGRLSISRESDAYSNNGHVHQNRQNKTCKPDAEELEAYRASFGFSADEIITTTNYVEISDVLEDSFSMTPFTSNKPVAEEHILTTPTKDGAETQKKKGRFF